jgi:hypothetical protein
MTRYKTKLKNQVNGIKIGKKHSMLEEEEECIKDNGGEARRKEVSWKT